MVNFKRFGTTKRYLSLALLVLLANHSIQCASERRLDFMLRVVNVSVASMAVYLGYKTYQIKQTADLIKERADVIKEKAIAIRSITNTKEFSKACQEANAIDEFVKKRSQHILANGRLTDIYFSGKCSHAPCNLAQAQIGLYGTSLKGKDLSNVTGLENAHYKRCSNSWFSSEINKTGLSNREIADKLSAGYILCE